MIDLDPASYERKRSMSCNKESIEECDAMLAAPVKIGQYSLTVEKETEHREIIFNDSYLTYLWMPPKGEQYAFDLSESYDKFRHINWCAAANVKLDEFLQWIIKNRKQLFSCNDQKPLETDFITYRGVLTKILVTPFVRDKWLIGATKFKGTIYLCPYYEHVQLDKVGNEMSYGGLRFEHYLTRSNPNETNKTEPFTSKKEEYSIVMRSKVQSNLGKIYLMYAAEVDCLDLGKTDSNIMENFVEIKTTRHMRHENQIRNFQRFKLIKWWAQSYLIGVSKIICGYKDDRHVVDDIESMDVHQIPRKCAQHWSRRQCLNFLRQFLSFVQQTVVDDDPHQVYLFSNEDTNQISTRKLLISSHYQILPDWYIREWSKNSKNVDLL